MKTCDFHQMTSFLGITWLIQSKFKKNNKANIDSKCIFYISFSDNPEALINAIFLNNGAYFGLKGRQDHVHMTWGDITMYL
jgi:hypothetical protein